MIFEHKDNNLGWVISTKLKTHILVIQYIMKHIKESNDWLDNVRSWSNINIH